MKTLYNSAENENFVQQYRKWKLCTTVPKMKTLYNSAENENFVQHMPKMKTL